MAARHKDDSSAHSTRKVAKSYLVVCEGETEVNYLKGFKRTLSREQQRTLKIEPLKAEGTDCMNVVKEAIERKEQADNEGVPYEEVWAFFDDDNQGNIQNSFIKANAKEIKVAFSSISFEVWFLLHFEYTGRQFQNGDEVVTALKRYWPDYSKPAFDSWENLQDRLSTAIQNAKNMRKNLADSKDISLNNPFTNVDLLLTSIGLLFFPVAEIPT